MKRIELSYTDAAGVRQGVKRAFSISCTVGNDENDFVIKLPLTDTLPLHGFAYVDGTEWGGVVDGYGVDASGAVPVSTWTGRTWSGILAKSIVMPEGDHYVMDGEANSAIASLLERQGLDGVFFADRADSGLVLSSYQVERFADAYSAIRSALATVGGALSVERRGSSTMLSAVRARNLAETDGDSASFTASVNTRPTNHLVCTGEGEDQSRVVVHLFADEEGNVSRTQTLFGIDEVTEQYDYSNADEAQLVEDGTKKLQELQSGASQGEVTSPGVADPRVGDVVRFNVPSAGFGMTAPVTAVNADVGVGSGVTATIQLGDVMPVKLTGSAGGGVGYAAVQALETRASALEVAQATG